MEIEDAGGETEEGTTGMIAPQEAGVVDQSSQSSNQVLVHMEGGGHRFVDKDKWPCLVVKETEGYRTIEGSQESMGLGEVVADVREGEQNKKQALIFLEQKKMESEQEDWEMANRSQRKRSFAPTVAARKSSRHQPTPQEPGTSQNNTNPFDILHSEYEISGGSQDEREDEIWGETDNLYTDGTIINSCDSDVLIKLDEQCGIVMGGMQ
jgi:hypothetical protein